MYFFPDAVLVNPEAKEYLLLFILSWLGRNDIRGESRVLFLSGTLTGIRKIISWFSNALIYDVSDQLLKIQEPSKI